jgi:hypothetical protein
VINSRGGEEVKCQSIRRWKGPQRRASRVPTSMMKFPEVKRFKGQHVLHVLELMTLASTSDYQDIPRPRGLENWKEEGHPNIIRYMPKCRSPIFEKYVKSSYFELQKFRFPVFEKDVKSWDFELQRFSNPMGGGSRSPFNGMHLSTLQKPTKFVSILFV